jgi:hypothetical protein
MVSRSFKAFVACCTFASVLGGFAEQTWAQTCRVIFPEFLPRSLWRADLWPVGSGDSVGTTPIPYVFAGSVTRENRIRTRAAMDELEYVCDVRFIPRTSEVDYLTIQASTENSSFVGRQGGSQIVNIFNWETRSIIIHELMHALGVFHEQSRPDRDQYIQVNTASIQPSALVQYAVVPAAVPVGEFDFESVMLYNDCAFSTCCTPQAQCACSASCQTMTALPAYAAFQNVMGRATALSRGDVEGLRSRYGASTAWTRTLAASINPANNKVYVLMEQSTWTLAERRAVDLGGHLATVRSAAEDQYIYTTYANFAGRNRNLWIGLYDQDQANNSLVRADRRLEFGWISGLASPYTNWSSAEPNNPSSNETAGNWEFYVHIWQPGDVNQRRWNNLSDVNTVFNVPVCGVAEVCAFARASPEAITACAGSSTQVALAVTGTGPFAYRWQRNGVPLLPDARYAGITTPQLRILRVEAGTVGDYTCVITNSCGSVSSSTTSVSLAPAQQCLVCDSVDFNNDQISPDSDDLNDFVAVFAGGPTTCSTYPTPGCNDLDFNNDGLFPDSGDLDAFLSRLAGGACL